MVEVSPSIISSDLSHLYDEIKRCEDAGAGSFHLDVMDGHFVNNITMGPDLIRAIRKSTGLRLDAHLMIERPDKYYKSFLDAGADVLLIHYESPVNTMELLKKFHRENIRYGIVINPETNFERVKSLIENAEILLIMSVNPGFSGQKFIDDSLIKVSQAREFIRANNLKTRIEIDGGINDETGRLAANAGADILVSASFIFKNGVINPIKTLKNF
ncbi:ribulose-phosphate 3-epimerase [Picrophilus oshimae]|uniref:Ribulose-phosphate 3-epimerase n=1 Tax=Picrophilus torridus (strain ATCC 700027 / DSM 9790 / JCM 10055 / NBRC 100828 / KAW 2/3) TaxID=1122961 RepID=A0A8G2FVH9_PICTO|nr:ribulose-phosphate 3-epimerase [Picrophilus oshimae]SMD30260.1 ribulose-5-phosphate 3-epimerase [Picrophilus oshimae DSM 9789]